MNLQMTQKSSTQQPLSSVTATSGVLPPAPCWDAQVSSEVGCREQPTLVEPFAGAKPFACALPCTAQKLQQLGLAVIDIEAKAVAALAERIDVNFVQACQYMLACEGRIVVLGMGKSGHIGGKIAATLASTGSPAFFVHPGEASHGDLGMITEKDVVLALSNSGETDEILTILPLIKRLLRHTDINMHAGGTRQGG